MRYGRCLRSLGSSSALPTPFWGRRVSALAACSTRHGRWSPLQAGERAVGVAGGADGGADVALREVGPQSTRLGWDAHPPPPPSAHSQAGCAVVPGRSCRQEGHHHHQEARRHLGHPGVLIRVRAEIMGSQKCRRRGISVSSHYDQFHYPPPRTRGMKLLVRPRGVRGPVPGHRIRRVLVLAFAGPTNARV
eukprot:COSAG01_NODE_5662_length_4113_cov_3.017190_2_plen_191_part_00